MLYRCFNPKSTVWDRYGGRGISVCYHWQNVTGFYRFVDDMGARPEGRSLDRKDNDQGYLCPRCGDNCRWATATEQMRNRRPYERWRRKAA